MRNLFLIFGLICLTFRSIELKAQSQNNGIISDLNWDELSDLLDKRYNDFTENGKIKVMLFIYIESENNKINVYSDFLSEKDQLVNVPPSLVIRTKSGVVVPVYLGIENKIKRGENYIIALKELADKYLYPVKSVINLDTFTWCWQFENGALKKSYGENNKKADRIPSWIYGGNK